MTDILTGLALIASAVGVDYLRHKRQQVRGRR